MSKNRLKSIISNKIEEKDDTSCFYYDLLFKCHISFESLIAETFNECIDGTGKKTFNNSSSEFHTLSNSRHPCSKHDDKITIGSIYQREFTIIPAKENEVEVFSNGRMIILKIKTGEKFFELSNYDLSNSPKNFYLYCDTVENPEILNAFLTLVSGNWIDLDENEFPSLSCGSVWSRRDLSSANGPDLFINKIPNPFKDRFICLPFKLIIKALIENRNTVELSINLGSERIANHVSKQLNQKIKINHVLIWNSIIRQVELISKNNFITLDSYNVSTQSYPIILEVFNKRTNLYYYDIDWNIDVEQSRLFSLEMKENKFNLSFFNNTINYEDIEVFYLMPLDLKKSYNDLINKQIEISEKKFIVRDYAPFSSPGMKYTKKIRTAFSWLMFDSDLSQKPLITKKDFANFIKEILPHPLKEIVCLSCEETDYLFGIRFSTVLYPDENNMASPITIILLPCNINQNINTYNQYIMWLQKRIEEKAIVGTTIKLQLDCTIITKPE